MEGDYLTVAQGREYLGISRTKMWLLLREGAFPVYANPLNGRTKLIRKADLDRFREPKLIGPQ